MDIEASKPASSTPIRYDIRVFRCFDGAQGCKAQTPLLFVVDFCTTNQLAYWSLGLTDGRRSGFDIYSIALCDEKQLKFITKCSCSRSSSGGCGC